MPALPAVVVESSQVPNIITPNGDGENDTFRPLVGGCPGRLQVFSRWGAKVYDVPEYHNDWGAAGLPAGLYYYLLDGADAAAQLKRLGGGGAVTTGPTATSKPPLPVW